jgi:hypothetical protein
VIERASAMRSGTVPSPASGHHSHSAPTARPTARRPRPTARWPATLGPVAVSVEVALLTPCPTALV